MTRIPADVDVPDKVLFGLTGRQVVILAGTACVLWGSWQLCVGRVPMWLFGVGAVPVAVLGLALALLRRDGLGLDQLLAAAAAFRTRPQELRHPGRDRGSDLPAWLRRRGEQLGAPGDGAGGFGMRLPGRRRRGALHGAGLGVGDGRVFAHDHGGLRIGVLDLGSHGAAVIAACSTVNLALRTEEEQHALVGSFARLLASAGGPVQIVVRTQPVDLAPMLAEIHRAAAQLPHPALRAAAAGHHDYLADIARAQPLTRQVLLVLREPTPLPAARPTSSGLELGGPVVGGPGRAAVISRLLGRLGEAQRCLAAAEITVNPLDAAAAEAVLAAVADPDRPLSALSGHARTGPPRNPHTYPIPAEPEPHPPAAGYQTPGAGNSGTGFDADPVEAAFHAGWTQ